ncbi:MAG: hypothetical protein HQK92_07580 [Nitrospirae bacterium]|nr:hypothetical protein [Nitrospirota bacterium]
MFDEETIKEFQFIDKIIGEAVKEAQEINRQNGLPNIYSKNKKIYYELPDGRIMNHEELCNYAETTDLNLLFLCR